MKQDAAESMQLIRDLTSEDKSPKDIALELNERRVPYARGRAWSAAIIEGVQRILGLKRATVRPEIVGLPADYCPPPLLSRNINHTVPDYRPHDLRLDVWDRPVS